MIGLFFTALGVRIRRYAPDPAALAYVRRAGRGWRKGEVVIVNLSGRGDKDVQQIVAWKAKRGRR